MSTYTNETADGVPAFLFASVFLRGALVEFLAIEFVDFLNKSGVALACVAAVVVVAVGHVITCFAIVYVSIHAVAVV